MKIGRREAAGFATAGAAAYATDLAVFLTLRGPAALPPLPAKAISFLVGCTVAYLGNALGTYRGRAAAAAPPRAGLRRYAAFFAVNLAGALVQLVCLGFAHYVLGLATARDDVVSGLGVGMALATAVRFWGTRTFVFGPPAAEAGPSVPAAGEGNRPTWTG